MIPNKFPSINPIKWLRDSACYIQPLNAPIWGLSSSLRSKRGRSYPLSPLQTPITPRIVFGRFPSDKLLQVPAVFSTLQPPQNYTFIQHPIFVLPFLISLPPTFFTPSDYISLGISSFRNLKNLKQFSSPNLIKLNVNDIFDIYLLSWNCLWRLVDLFLYAANVAKIISLDVVWRIIVVSTTLGCHVDNDAPLLPV